MPTRDIVEHRRSDGSPFVFIHVGDLHITELDRAVSDARRRRVQQFDSDLKAIFSEIDRIGRYVDFVYLPGDLAENAGREEYAVLASVLDDHPDVAVRLIPGDHDLAQGGIQNFKDFRGALTGNHLHHPPVQNNVVDGRFTGCPPRASTKTIEQFYFEETINGVLCLFLDLVTAGHGYKGVGLDFRIGHGPAAASNQMTWLSDKVQDAERNGLPCAVFMHAYPHDLADRDEIQDVAGLFWRTNVRLVEMGHTHYNELAHDGRTLYATARSVGQNEDGPAGYAVVAIDTVEIAPADPCGSSESPSRLATTTSWRFKPLQQTLPFVLITSPADRRLATEALVTSGGRVTVRALVLWDEGQAGTCCCRVDDGPWTAMDPVPGTGMYELPVPWPSGSRSVSVRARDDGWTAVDGGDLVDIDTIEPAPLHASPTTERDRFKPGTLPDVPGSDAFAVGPWPEKGVRGDQLGPNKKGHRW